MIKKLTSVGVTCLSLMMALPAQAEPHDNYQFDVTLAIDGDTVLKNSLEVATNAVPKVELYTISDDRQYMLEFNYTPLEISGSEDDVVKLEASVYAASSSERITHGETGYSDFVNFEGVSVQKIAKHVEDKEFEIVMPKSTKVNGAVITYQHRKVSEKISSQHQDVE